MSGFQAPLLARRPALRRELRVASWVRQRAERPRAEFLREELLPMAAQAVGRGGELAAVSGFAA
jgi:hypothetical protein